MLKILGKSFTILINILHFIAGVLGWLVMATLVLILVFNQGTIGTKSSCYGNQQQCLVKKGIKQCNN